MEVKVNAENHRQVVLANLEECRTKLDLSNLPRRGLHTNFIATVLTISHSLWLIDYGGIVFCGSKIKPRKAKCSGSKEIKSVGIEPKAPRNGAEKSKCLALGRKRFNSLITDF